MSIIYSQEIYNEIVVNKKYNEEVIAEIYSNYSSMSFDDKLIATDVIYDLKTINEEYDKYIISYQQRTKAEKIKSEYVVVEGDTLHKIAHQFTGDVSNWSLIYRYNNLKDIKLSPGDIIKIPETF